MQVHHDEGVANRIDPRVMRRCPRGHRRSVDRGAQNGFPLQHTDGEAGRHINSSATFRIKCGRPHFMPELGSYGCVRGGREVTRVPTTKGASRSK